MREAHIRLYLLQGQERRRARGKSPPEVATATRSGALLMLLLPRKEKPLLGEIFGL